MSVLTWGQVTAVNSGSLNVRFAGDQTDVIVTVQNEDVTFATSDRVLLAKVGAQSWVVVCSLGDVPA